MSYLEFNHKAVPTGWHKLLALNWPIILLLTAIAGVGFLMLNSVAGGQLARWGEPQIWRFLIGLIGLFITAMIPIWFWRNISFVIYFVALILLVAVEFIGVTVMGAQRWIDLGFMRLQPSELMKVASVLALAAYYDWLPPRKISHPFWLAIPILIVVAPAMLVLRQPDLGTSILLLATGGIIIFLAGVHWGYFMGALSIMVGAIVAIFQSRGTGWQLIKDYQFRRIDTFLNPEQDPLGAGYHITQAKIALGGGGWSGKGYMQGTQSRLNFLPEKHTDFIYTTLAEEFGFVGSLSLLMLYALVLVFCIFAALTNKDRYSSLLTYGIGMVFFLFFSVNIAMVTGLIPIVGVPLPLVSYGGSSMLIIMFGFGLVQSAHIHRPITRQR